MSRQVMCSSDEMFLKRMHVFGLTLISNQRFKLNVHILL